MIDREELSWQLLRRRCDPNQFEFETTEAIADSARPLGQERAVESLRFGVEIHQPNFHLYVMGPPGTGKHSLGLQLVTEQARREPVPDDWCYVFNFQDPSKPKSLRFRAGRARLFANAMQQLVEDLKVAIPSVFESDEYRLRVSEIEQSFQRRREQALQELRSRAESAGLALLQTPAGFIFAPVRGGQVLDPETYNRLPPEERNRIETTIKELQEELVRIIREIPRWRREAQRKIRELNRSFVQAAVTGLVEEVRKNFSDHAEVLDYLADVEKDLLLHTETFRQPREETSPIPGLPLPQWDPLEMFLHRYQVNVLIDHSQSQGAPVVYEDNPTYQNLVGRIEHVPHLGALVTDFTLIRSGALHRANGGYLLLDAWRLLTQPYAWEGLKRVLYSGKIRVESLGHALGWAGTVALEPQPIPVQVKVILIGERFLYYLLHSLDPDFRELFQVISDFEEAIARDPRTEQEYAQLLASMARSEGLLPLDQGGIARMVEESSRMSGDAEKLSIQTGQISTLLQEADYWARSRGSKVIGREDVERAVAARVRRADRVRQRILEETLRGRLLIDTEGSIIGQINGLSVWQLGDYTFGHPTGITARVRFGSGKVVDIEREVALGGPIHSKGVLILTGFLLGRYLPEEPLSLAATLVFEQSYQGVEGDSASAAELFALLSALGGVPIKQAIAVTGSVNQHGIIQPVGGVNEKIEGFFDVCRARGLTGEQGVIIPAANRTQLMLREDVVEAVREGKFHIYAVETVDQGMEILTGIPAGERGSDGRFPPSTINGRVEARLAEFAQRARAFQPERAEVK
ncbi:Lon protease family protein [Candidatus Methylacidithermus pantelleriae]|uniref:endopeptidase La n=1 Tax=Candidatus Methylacidithermus pantelleriae TaxID=2744239 RepID=A0A8J2FV50_9BACT|nr:AAA family ATPase [Candidatus Methylacidithermus pantelleriae]CAF0689841.1 ATP-dependent protease La Type II [Candidatus Methylacidithermus pantelleriae]